MADLGGWLVGGAGWATAAFAAFKYWTRSRLQETKMKAEFEQRAVAQRAEIEQKAAAQRAEIERKALDQKASIEKDAEERATTNYWGVVSSLESQCSDLSEKVMALLDKHEKLVTDLATAVSQCLGLQKDHEKCQADIAVLKEEIIQLKRQQSGRAPLREELSHGSTGIGVLEAPA